MRSAAQSPALDIHTRTSAHTRSNTHFQTLPPVRITSGMKNRLLMSIYLWFVHLFQFLQSRTWEKIIEKKSHALEMESLSCEARWRQEILICLTRLLCVFLLHFQLQEITRCSCKKKGDFHLNAWIKYLQGENKSIATLSSIDLKFKRQNFWRNHLHFFYNIHLKKALTKSYWLCSDLKVPEAGCL